MDNGATCKMCGNYTSNKDGTPDGGCLKCGSEGPNLREIWAAADKKAKDWREAGEEKLLRQMLDWQGLAAGAAPRSLDPLQRGHTAEAS